MSEVLLDLKDVSVQYSLKDSSFYALKNINLTVKRGEFIAIIGTSGAGKSTLMNIMGLMASATSGEIRINSMRTGDLSADDLAILRNENIGFIFQHFHLLPKLTVLENILLPFQYAENLKMTHVQAYARALDLIKVFGLEGQDLKKPASLSGGQKQRVAICRSLILNPDIILADEPTGALDSKNALAVLEILKNLNESGKTVIVITHDPAVAAHAQRVLRISDGEIVSDEQHRQNQTQSSSILPQHTEVTKPRGFLVKERFQSLLQNVRISIQSLVSNRVRAFLTCVGLMIGVASVIIMVTLSVEAQRAFKSFFDTNSGNKAWVVVDRRNAQLKGEPTWQGLHVRHEVETMTQLFKNYGRVEPALSVSDCSANSALYSTSTSLSGISNSAEIHEANMKIAKGREFLPVEVLEETQGRVVMLGSEAADKLFPKTDPGYGTYPEYPVGQWVHISNCAFYGAVRVVGTLKQLDNPFRENVNSTIYIPSNGLLLGGISQLIKSFIITPNPGVSAVWFANSVTNYLKVKTSNRISFRQNVPEKNIKDIYDMISIFQMLTLVVGSLCVVIGGIGVMNIMLVTITERIREIGLRKALGARSFRIRNQFLFESVLLCIVSGVFGLFVGVAICNLAYFAASLLAPAYIRYHFILHSGAVILALVASLLSGLTFGILPAKRAGNLDVVEALRHE